VKLTLFIVEAAATHVVPHASGPRIGRVYVKLNLHNIFLTIGGVTYYEVLQKTCSGTTYRQFKRMPSLATLDLITFA